MPTGCHHRSRGRSCDSYPWSPDRCRAPARRGRSAWLRELAAALILVGPSNLSKIEILFSLLHLFARRNVDFLNLFFCFVHNLLDFQHGHNKVPRKRSIVRKGKRNSQTSRFWSRMSSWRQRADLPHSVFFIPRTRSRSGSRNWARKSLPTLPASALC